MSRDAQSSRPYRPLKYLFADQLSARLKRIAINALWAWDNRQHGFETTEPVLTHLQDLLSDFERIAKLFGQHRLSNHAAECDAMIARYLSRSGKPSENGLRCTISALDGFVARCRALPKPD
ncbi:MAG: hypothetical protein AAF755_06100 [Pseudomonadota bacterium]